MAKQKKFGTFGGVFTPSILTILGVIMYLRFPTIIGQAGLINTIGIIIIAHLISITTSLSVASLSTDKPVQNGGTYFMISRSLGLPIGGTLGLALFVGLSFSVSLYLIGFAESFLQYWGFADTIQNIRLTGTIILLVVTTITFISTSLAIKSQYFIMVAIVLSLLSIFLGHHEFHPEHINLKPLATTAPFMVLFGIFFPAVTGFEAGVSMSGDLKDPKKSLPLGATLAVGVGLIVYIALAFFYAYTVDAEALVNDPQILFKIALVPGLVIIGIWGATLSSALGSILGAPRILQAIAMDKIAPGFLAKGTGATNEPRNALILTFFIAEAGILIGELDVIARIVSMFFITTYAFLNLAAAIESWSSSDYRPAFKIPRFVSVLGAISAFFVMILLDFLALAGATLVLGFLYFMLRRKELILESGDAWSSFWTNIAKTSLLKLSAKKDNTRNWRPNIILFSGGEKARPHLVKMGLALTGKLGALTDFNLVSTSQKIDTTLPSINEDDKNDTSYFLRTLNCENILQGIETVTSVYGFSGFEPNTVLMGWSKSTHKSAFLVDTLQTLKAKSFNTLFLVYNKEKGFGAKENIDLWWNGKGRFLSFALTTLKFLQSSSEWRDATVRLFIINSDTTLHDNIYSNAAALLNEARVTVEIKIISDDFGSRTKEEIIHSESSESDLVLLGISPKDSSLTEDYIDHLNALTNLPVSSLLLYPSSEFEEVNLVEKTKSKQNVLSAVNVTLDLPQLPELKNEIISGRLEELDQRLMSYSEKYANAFSNDFISHLQEYIENLLRFSTQNKANLLRDIANEEGHLFMKTLERYHYSFLNNSTKLLEKGIITILPDAEKSLISATKSVWASLGNEIHNTSDQLLVAYIKANKTKESHVKYALKSQLEQYIYTLILSQIQELYKTFEALSVVQYAQLRENLLGINDAYEQLKVITQKTDREAKINLIEVRLQKMQESIDEIKNFSLSSQQLIGQCFRQVTMAISQDLGDPELLKNRKQKKNKIDLTLSTQLLEYAEEWGNNSRLYNNTLYLDTLILTQKNVAKNIIIGGNEKIKQLINEKLQMPMLQLKEMLSEIMEQGVSTQKAPSLTHKVSIANYFNETFSKISDLIGNTPTEMAVPEKASLQSDVVSIPEHVAINVTPLKSAIYNTDTFLREPLYRDIEQLEIALNQSLMECKEINSLLLFQLNNIENNKEDDQSEHLKIFKKLFDQLEVQDKALNVSIKELDAHANNYLQEAFSKRFYHAIIGSAKTVDSGLREQKNKHFSQKIKNFKLKITHQMNQLVVYVVNNASNGVLFSKKYLKGDDQKISKNQHLLNAVDHLTPNSNIYSKVPIFYRNLISSSSKINDEFYIARPTEMKVIKDALQRHKNGLGGALIIKGIHGAGKTTLTRYAVQHLFKKQNIYWIESPDEEASYVDQFSNQLKRFFPGFADNASILEAMPYASTIVVNDLELWWERRPGGGDMMTTFIALIKNYSHKIFFVFNSNSYALNTLQLLYPFEDNALAIVECEAFNAKELQDMILARHQSSGLSLNYQGREEATLTQLHYSFLFNSYFNISHGIPGQAFNTWKSNITAVKNDTIDIRKPLKSNTNILHYLDNEYLLVIALFVQHKKLDFKKLARITQTSDGAALDVLQRLKNAGLIVSAGGSTYTLDPYIEPYLVNHCLSKGII